MMLYSNDILLHYTQSATANWIIKCKSCLDSGGLWWADVQCL